MKFFFLAIHHTVQKTNCEGKHNFKIVYKWRQMSVSEFGCESVEKIKSILKDGATSKYYFTSFRNAIFEHQKSTS